MTSNFLKYLSFYLLSAAVILFSSGILLSQPVTEPLWVKGVPLAAGDEEADRPTVTIYPAPAEIANGASVVICPGGAYVMLAMDHEGYQVAEWLNSIGVTAFVLKYRLAPRYRHPVPLLDAQRAIRFVRANVRRWNLDAARIGILGFSAGGHLASTAGTHYDGGNPNAEDPIDRVSSRPDFMILVYPVISFTTAYVHSFSQKMLIGENPSPELIENLSNEKQVDRDTPPTFLMHTSRDTGVPAENSILFYMALHRAGVPAEMHVYEPGRHGFGLAPQDPALSAWKDRCRDWLWNRGLLFKR